MKRIEKTALWDGEENKHVRGGALTKDLHGYKQKNTARKLY